MDIILSKEPIDLQESDLLITAIFKDQRPPKGTAGWIDWRLNGMLSRFLIENRLTGEEKEKTLIPSQGRISPGLILIFGLGDVKEYSYLSVRKMVPFILQTIKDMKMSRICLSLPYGEEVNADCGKLIEVFLEGLADSLDQSSSDREWAERLTLSLSEGEERFSEVLLGIQTAKSILEERLTIRILTPSESSPF